MPTLKPREKVVKYSLDFYEIGFANDSCGGPESSTPFMPIHVGDLISRRSAAIKFPFENKDFRVTAVKHVINQYGSEIVHDVEVCLEPADSPELSRRPQAPPKEPGNGSARKS